MQGGSSVLQVCYFASRKTLISYKPDINKPADKYPKRTEYASNSETQTDVFLAKKKLYKLYLSKKLKIGAFVIYGKWNQGE